MDFEEQIKQELESLTVEQQVAFAWRCAVRALPLLGYKGDFSFWEAEEIQVHLYRVLSALDFVYVAAAAVAAYAARAARATARAFAFGHVNLDQAIMQDLKNIKSDSKADISIAPYGKIWDNFQQALQDAGCTYWGKWYQQLFENNFEFDPTELEKRINIPGEIRKQGTAAVAAYMERIAVQGSQALNEGKMILLGDGAAGKSALVERLVLDTFSGETEMTEGIDIKLWEVEDISMHIWDFGGQEIMRAMHQFFMTPRTLYLLVCTHRTDESDAHIEDWLRLIQTFGGNSPVLIVKSKSDQHELNLDENRLQDLYPNIQGFFNTSAKKGTGIKSLHKAISKALAHHSLAHIKDQIPKIKSR